MKIFGREPIQAAGLRRTGADCDLKRIAVKLLSSWHASRPVNITVHPRNDSPQSGDDALAR